MPAYERQTPTYDVGKTLSKCQNLLILLLLSMLLMPFCITIAVFTLLSISLEVQILLYSSFSGIIAVFFWLDLYTDRLWEMPRRQSRRDYPDYGPPPPLPMFRRRIIVIAPQPERERRCIDFPNLGGVCIVLLMFFQIWGKRKISPRTIITN